MIHHLHYHHRHHCAAKYLEIEEKLSGTAKDTKIKKPTRVLLFGKYVSSKIQNALIIVLNIRANLTGYHENGHDHM